VALREANRGKRTRSYVPIELASDRANLQYARVPDESQDHLLSRLEDRIGVRLPEDYRSFLLTRTGSEVWSEGATDFLELYALGGVLEGLDAAESFQRQTHPGQRAASRRADVPIGIVGAAESMA
jgi:hypothetical protein